MGLLAPWFLIGLAGLAAPLYLHLLRRQTTDPKPFSSLMFFEPRTQSSMRHRRLRYLLLLALRLALLLLLVFAFANPFVLRPAASVSSHQLTLLVVDKSFSMRAHDSGSTRLQAAQRAATAAVNALGGPGEVMTLGARLTALEPPTSDRARLRAAVASIQPGDARADFATLAAGLRTIAQQHPEPIRVALFSDLLQTGLPSQFSGLALPANVHLTLHPVGAAAPNWTVASVAAPAHLFGPPPAPNSSGTRGVATQGPAPDPSRMRGAATQAPAPNNVTAVVAGFATSAAALPVELLVNGKVVSRQTAHVPPSGRATVVFPRFDFPYGWSEGQVRITGANDLLPDDDSARFAVERSDPARVLFVHAAGDTRSELYFSAALSAGGNAAFRLDDASAGSASGLNPATLKPYALVVLAGAPELTPAFERALTQYVRSGGGVLISTGANTRSVPLFDTPATPLNYGQRAIVVGASDASHPVTALLGNWPGVHFFFADRIAPGDARVLARLSDQTPILMDKTIGAGHALLLASGLGNLSNDFPLQPAFVAFVRQAAAYLAATGAAPPPARTVGDFLTLRTAREQGVSVQGTTPDGHALLSLRDSTRARSLELERVGFYRLRAADGREQLVAVNRDLRESDLTPIPTETARLWTGSPQTPAGGAPATGAPAAGAVASPKVRVSLWWYVLLAMLLAALAESWAAARHFGLRRESELDALPNPALEHTP
ncbi:MAG: BatA domain-containing protein [Terriglobales bacterium]